MRNIAIAVLFFLFSCLVVYGGYSLRVFNEAGIGHAVQNNSQMAAGNAASPADDAISLIAVGDISYSRAVARTVREHGDINFPFAKIREYLRSGDIVFGNLETSLTEGREINDFEMIFRSDPSTATALHDAGFSVASLANNHTPNFGAKGLGDTLHYLDAASIAHVGAGMNAEEARRPAYISVKGVLFAFLAYNDSDVVPPSYEADERHAGTAFMRSEVMAEAVREAKQRADVVVVSMHAGNEYEATPNESQVRFAHTAIDAGADVVIGHHPHVVQTMERYKNKYIFYSLGNFVFDQYDPPETKEGLAIKLLFKKGGAASVEYQPVIIEHAQPRSAAGEEAERILKKLSKP